MKYKIKDNYEKKNFFKDHKDLICPITKNKNFKLCFSIKNFPIYMGTVPKNFKASYKDMNFYINRNSGTVQIFPRVNLKKLYFKSHGSGKVGKIWREHHNLFFKFLNINGNENILEVGGGHNSVSIRSIKKKRPKVYSFDPNIKIIKKNNRIYNEFFSYKSLKKYNLKGKFDIAVHSHLLEHIYQPESFLNTIFDSLKDNGLHIFAVPNMKPMIKKGIASAMNFEHPFFLDENMIEVLLKKTGFKILEKKYYGKHHSIFYKTIKFKKIEEVKSKNFFKKNYQIFKSLRQNWAKNINKINNKVEQILKKNPNKKIFIFGAHIFSQNLIKTGLNLDCIHGILDNDPKKQKEYLYGTKIKVFSPKILKNFKDPVIILRAGEYNTEIKKQILSDINEFAKFI